MEAFSALLAICARNSPVPGEFPTQRPVTQSFDVYFDLRPNKRWVNKREAGDLRHNRAHYDVIVMTMHVFIPTGWQHINKPIICDLTFMLSSLHAATGLV